MPKVRPLGHCQRRVAVSGGTYHSPKYIGRSLSLVLTDNKVMTPRYMPLPPTPAMTRPMMKAFKFGAAPQRAEPTMNKITEPRYRLGVEHAVELAERKYCSYAADGEAEIMSNSVLCIDSNLTRQIATRFCCSPQSRQPQPGY